MIVSEDKVDRQMVAELICRLLIEAMTQKSADGVPANVVQDGSFVFNLPSTLGELKFRVLVEEVE
jgi:hypothetical protein